jgi:prepilin-type N-terminal cleavage/methylation domain-containing protein
MRVPAAARVRRRGFTLVEMMIVIVVMIILAGLGGPTLVTSFNHAKVRRVAAMLIADLQYAQDLAARERRPVVVLVVPDVCSYVIRDRATSTVYRQRFLGDDTDYGVNTLTASPGSSVQVFPNGAAQTTTTFTVGVPSYQRQVTLTQAGQIRLLPPASK